MPSNDFLHQTIRITLRPFIRLLLRYGMGYGEFAQVCKKLFVEVADSDFRIADRKQTVSRISVLTGITRREIKQIRECSGDTSNEYTHCNHAARVLVSWHEDVEFQDDKGNPAPLPINSEGHGTFNMLTQKYGNNTPYRAILDELVRVGAVTMDDVGIARVISEAYVPSKESQKQISAAMQSIAMQIATVDSNDTNQ